MRHRVIFNIGRGYEFGIYRWTNLADDRAIVFGFGLGVIGWWYHEGLVKGVDY